MARHKYDYDLIVIGSGAGGSVAADIVAASGKRVALIESDTLGGEAANWGDVPTKALLQAANVYDIAKNGAPFGIRSAAVGYNYPSVKAWKDLAVRRTGVASSDRYYQSRGIGVYRGAAHFISPHEISVNRRHLSAENFLIATGSHWVVPAVEGLDKVPYLTARTALDLVRPPKTLFIIGGGAVGTEFAELFSTFGTKVYIADMTPRLLPKEDEEVSEVIEEHFRHDRGMTVLTKTKVLKVVKEGIVTRVTYLRGDEQHSVKVDQVLVAAGKMPTVDIGLENAGVEYTPKGVAVNDFLQTSASHIYAAGDVIGTNMYTHVGVYESRVVAHNLMNRNKLTPDYRAVPHVTYLPPEVASVGLNAADCLKRDLTVKTATAPLNIIGRANIANQKEGFVKVITDRKGVLIGATIVSPHAGEMIHELGLAIHYEMSAFDVASAMHAFPSWSEAIRVACSKIK
jgi:pyruvate/2-oxoglutarate dehydrogenase complex dihydrolipoamide dehydrogenase (E3) component